MLFIPFVIRSSFDYFFIILQSVHIITMPDCKTTTTGFVSTKNIVRLSIFGVIWCVGTHK